MGTCVLASIWFLERSISSRAGIARLDVGSGPEKDCFAKKSCCRFGMRDAPYKTSPMLPAHRPLCHILVPIQDLWFISKRKRRSLLAHWHCINAGGGIAHRLRCWYVITPRQASKACLRRSIRKNLSERCLQLRAHLHHIITRLFQREY